ncbi:MAG: folate-binding protein [Actinomycetota bacterium]|nr:folate-binding protein [Actinomycetota bacterium]
MTEPVPAVMPSPLLSWPGAVAADPPDAGVAAHYGDPLREQRALADGIALDGIALVDRSNREVLRISGADRLSWLHTLTTQHLTDLAPGEATETLVLSPHGHVEHHLVLVDDGEAVWVHAEPGTADALLGFLESMRFLLRVEPETVTAAWAVLTLAGPEAAVLVPAGRATMTRAYGVDVLVPRELLAEQAGQLQRAGAAPVGIAAFEAVRVAERRPRLGLETDHRTIPHELGWIGSAVHLQKGCYRGQETVARVHNLGRPPRRLVFLHLDGVDEELPAHGDPVTLDGRPVGVITSAARHYELGPIALALVKRRTPVDAILDVGDTRAAQEVVVAA